MSKIDVKPGDLLCVKVVMSSWGCPEKEELKGADKDFQVIHDGTLIMCVALFGNNNEMCFLEIGKPKLRWTYPTNASVKEWPCPTPET